MHLPTVLLSFFTLPIILPIASLAIINSSPLTLTNPISLPTTNTNNTLTDPSEPHCVRITDPPMLGLNPTNCDLATDILCNRLASVPAPHLVRDRWIWTELVGCALGYYLPERAHVVPTQRACANSFVRLLELCATDSRFNAGGTNVEVMPGFAGDGTAEVVRSIRYVMAPERLTLP